MMNNYNYVKKLSLLRLESFLILNNWREKKTEKKLLPYKIYYTDDYSDSVFIPKEKRDEDNDYLYIIDSAIKTLSTYYNKNKFSLVEEISNIDKFVIYMRYESDTEENYNIPSNILNELLENGKKMFLSAYADSNLKDIRPYRRGTFPKEVLEIESQIEFGQTIKGSYIIPMLIPSEYKLNKLLAPTNLLDDLYVSEQLRENEDKISIATKKLINSIEVVKNKSKSNDDLSELVDIKNPNFTSIDFLSAMSNIGQESNHNFQVEFIVPSDDRQKSMSSTLSNTYTHKVKNFVDHYKSIKPENDEFIGKFIKIQVDHADIFNRETLSVQLEGQPFNSTSKTSQKIMCIFNYDKYSELIFTTTERGDTVYVKGDREGNKLYNCDLKILDQLSIK